MKKLLLLCLCLIMALSMTVGVSATETEAVDISKDTTVTAEGYKNTDFLFDKKIKTFQSSAQKLTLNLENSQGIGSLYLIMNFEYGPYTVTDNTTGQVLTAGSYGFLHEFLELEAAFGTAPTSVTIRFESGSVSLSEIYVFSVGQTPDFVQKWAPPLDGGADILMFPTHGDDDQLYFAGLLPLYAGELGLRVQVVYMTDHRNLTNVRTHEMLNGLWAVGVTAYPVFGEFIDFRDDSLEGTYRTFANNGVTREDITAFVVEQIRRFKPQVAIGHDKNGEYGHGMHKAYSAALREAVEISMDTNAFPESAEAYGTWDVPKTYLHLLEENPIVLDYDTPLERFDGLTAFQVTQKLGFPCHVSQQGYMFTPWLYGSNGEFTKVTQIKTYNPAHFGLYRTTVGEDVLKNDFMENIVCYAEQERLEQERLEQERLEQERLEQERLEQERLEQERLEQERLEQERLEQERLEQERLERERLEQERLEQDRLERERIAREAAQRKQRLTLATVVLAALILTLCVVLFKLRKKV